MIYIPLQYYNVHHLSIYLPLLVGFIFSCVFVVFGVQLEEHLLAFLIRQVEW